MIITNSDVDLEDIFDVRDSLDTEDLESFLDSRLDVESVLIDDIKLETDLMVYCSDSQSSGGSGDNQLLTSQQIKGKDRGKSSQLNIDTEVRCLYTHPTGSFYNTGYPSN